MKRMERRDFIHFSTYLALAGASLENGASEAAPLNPMGGSGEALLDVPAQETINVPDVA